MGYIYHFIITVFSHHPLLGVMDSKKPKHVVVMIADDLGWNEVSWNNPAIQTPHMQVKNCTL